MKNMTGKILFTAVAVLTAFASAEACTTWVIHSSASKTGRIMVNKCRDNTPGRVNADIVTTSRNWRFLRLGEYPIWAGFGMNEKGVVVTCNDGDALTVAHRRGEHVQINSPAILRQVLAECDNAYDGAVLYRDHCRAFRRPSGGKRNHGSTLLAADPKRVFIVDVGAGYGEIKEITGGMFIYSNKMHLPGNESISCCIFGGFLSDRARESNVRKVMHQYSEDGKFTLQGVIRASRAKCGEALKDKYPFRAITLGDTCFDLDPEFPSYLNTAYAAIGPQQHTVFLPIPMALRNMPEKIRNGKWGDRALEFRKKCGDDHPNVEKLYEFEATIFPEYDQVREDARKLLREGKTEEAVKLLSECFERQFKAADEFLDKLFEITPPCADPSKNSAN